LEPPVPSQAPHLAWGQRLSCSDIGKYLIPNFPFWEEHTMSHGLKKLPGTKHVFLKVSLIQWRSITLYLPIIKQACVWKNRTESPYWRTKLSSACLSPCSESKELL
jgi:hypothetical protein